MHLLSDNTCSYLVPTIQSSNILKQSKKLSARLFSFVIEDLVEHVLPAFFLEGANVGSGGERQNDKQVRLWCL